jgi:hypothetical protein
VVDVLSKVYDSIENCLNELVFIENLAYSRIIAGCLNQHADYFHNRFDQKCDRETWKSVKHVKKTFSSVVTRSVLWADCGHFWHAASYAAFSLVSKLLIEQFAGVQF